MSVEPSVAPREAVGIDLGLKSIATTSDGDTLEAGRWTHAYADKLARAQRHGHKRQAKRIHRKAARCRADALHKFSRKMVDRYQNIVDRRCEQPQAGQVADGQVRARFGLGDAQSAAAVQGPAGRQKRSGRRRELLNASLQQLRSFNWPHRSGQARCKALGVQCVWRYARSGRECGPKHPGRVQVRTSVSGNEPSRSPDRAEQRTLALARHGQIG